MKFVPKSLLFLTALIFAVQAKTQVISLPGSFTAFVTCSGSASATQSFVISATGLTGNLTVTVPSGFEVSASAGSGFAGSLSLTPAGGSVPATTLYVRLTAGASGSPSGAISCSSTGAVSKTIPVNGFLKPVPDVNQPASQLLCAGTNSAAVHITGSGGPGTQYHWTNSAPSIGLAASGTGDIPSFTAQNTGTAPVTATLSVWGSGQTVGPRAYVPLSGTNFYSALSVVDLATNTVLSTFLMPLHPAGISPSPDGSRIYITNRLSNFVSVLDPIDNSVITTIPVGGNPIFVNPSPDGSRLYVANTTSNNLSVINTSTNSVIATVPTGAWPAGIAVSKDGSRVYVASRDGDNLTVIDALTNTVISTIPLGGSGLAVALSADGTRLYVDLQEINGGVAIINTATNTLVGTIPVGSGPTGIVLNHAGTRLYVTNQISNTVSVINLATNAVITSFPVAGSGVSDISISPDDSRLYIGYFNTPAITVYDASNYNLVVSIPMSGYTAGHGNFINAGTGPLCTGTPKNFTVTVNPAPTVDVVPDQNLCSGNLTNAVSFTGGVSGTNFSWVNTNTSIGLAANGSGAIPSFTATNSTNAPVTASITVTPSYNGCTGNPISFSITVNPAASPVSIDSLPAEVCLSENPIPLSAHPAGGSWTGNGISGNQFSPAAAGLGTANLTYQFTNSGGCTTAASVSIKVKNCADSSVDICQQLQVLPNPSKGQFGIRVLSNRLRSCSVRIIDAAGKRVKVFRFDSPVAYGSILPFNLSSLPGGTYTLELISDDAHCVYRLLITR